MSHDINMYLDDLRRALVGADPAVIHDALYDAEEHLRSEFAAARAAQEGRPFNADATLESIMDAYGTPHEVAAAYLEAEGLSAVAGSLAFGTLCPPLVPRRPIHLGSRVRRLLPQFRRPRCSAW